MVNSQPPQVLVNKKVFLYKFNLLGRMACTIYAIHRRILSYKPGLQFYIYYLPCVPDSTRLMAVNLYLQGNYIHLLPCCTDRCSLADSINIVQTRSPSKYGRRDHILWYNKSHTWSKCRCIHLALGILIKLKEVFKVTCRIGPKDL